MMSVRAGRILIVALGSLVAIAAAFMSMVLFVGPSSSSIYAWFCSVFLMIAAWPFELWLLISHGTRPAGIVTFLLFVISGLFWAAVIDVFYELKKKYRR